MVRHVTHPQATAAGTPTARVTLTARLFDGSYATDTLKEFDVLVPVHLQHNSAIEKLLRQVTGTRFQVVNKELQPCNAF